MQWHHDVALLHYCMVLLHGGAILHGGTILHGATAWCYCMVLLHGATAWCYCMVLLHVLHPACEHFPKKIGAYVKGGCFLVPPGFLSHILTILCAKS